MISFYCRVYTPPEPGLAKLGLTPKQQTVFECIERYYSEHRQSPLIREIQSECQITSYKSALDRLTALERKWYIKRTPNKHRGIKLVKRSPAAQGAGSAATLLQGVA